MAKPYIVLKSYPKALFFYPILLVTFLILLAQWIDLTLWNWSSLIGIDYIDLSNILGLIWYIVFLFCLIVVSVEVKITKLLLVIFVIGFILVVLYYFGINFWEFMPAPSGQDFALPNTFYIIMCFFFGIVLIFALGHGRKKSLKIEQTGSRPNQITSKMGEHEEIFTTAEIEIDIETPDCFEHMLGTGSVTLKFPALNKFIQMNTVWRPKAKKKKIMNIWQMQ